MPGLSDSLSKRAAKNPAFVLRVRTKDTMSWLLAASKKAMSVGVRRSSKSSALLVMEVRASIRSFLVSRFRVFSVSLLSLKGIGFIPFLGSFPFRV